MGVFQWKGSIQFGAFVTIPVRAKKAVAPGESLSLEMLHEGCGGNMGYTQEWYCKAGSECPAAVVDEETGEVKFNVSRSDSVKGYHGHLVDEEYLKSLKADKSSVISLDGLVPAEQIDPRYFAESYDVTPEEGGEKAYVLLQKLMERSGKVAIGTAVMRDREQIVTIRPRDGIIAMETMYWPEDLTRAERDKPARERIADVVVTDAELALGDQLVGMLSKDFDPTQYKDVYAERVKAYLDTVDAGEDAPALPVAAKSADKGMDLLAQLQAAITASKESEVAAAKIA